MPRAFSLEILHFLWNYCISFGNIIKKHKIASLKKSTSSEEKKNRTSSVFMLE